MLDRRGSANVTIVTVIRHGTGRRNQKSRSKKAEFKTVLHCDRSPRHENEIDRAGYCEGETPMNGDGSEPKFDV
jgi:hypothetical protein